MVYVCDDGSMVTIVDMLSEDCVMLYCVMLLL